MNSEKVKYFILILYRINDEAFMVVFSIFSFGKKRISFDFSSFVRSLSFEGLLSPLRRCLSFRRLLSFKLLSFYRIGIS